MERALAAWWISLRRKPFGLTQWFPKISRCVRCGPSDALENQNRSFMAISLAHGKLVSQEWLFSFHQALVRSYWGLLGAPGLTTRSKKLLGALNLKSRSLLICYLIEHPSLPSRLVDARPCQGRSPHKLASLDASASSREVCEHIGHVLKSVEEIRTALTTGDSERQNCSRPERKL